MYIFKYEHLLNTNHISVRIQILSVKSRHNASKYLQDTPTICEQNPHISRLFFPPFCVARTTTVSGSHTSAYTFGKATVRRQAKGKIMEAKL